LSLSLTIAQLFTPAPATPQQISATNPGTDWLTKLMAVSTRLGLQVTDWFSGGVARTIMTAYCWMMSMEDTLVSGMVQGGFLDFAATGVVTYVDPTDGVTVITVPVTLDPSTNPGAGPGWLDILCDSTYNTQRIEAAPGAGIEVIANSGSSTGTFQPGTYHVLNPANGLTYSNLATLTISAATLVGTSISSITNTSPVAVTTSSPHGRASGDYVLVQGVSGVNAPNGIWQITVLSATQFILQGSTASGVYGAGGTVYLGQGASFQADIAGPGTSAPGTINQAVTVVPGVVVSNPAAFVGTPAESNVALAARARLSLGGLSPNGPKSAYQYLALTAYQKLGAGIVTQPVTRVEVLPNTVTGVLQVVLANASGPVTGCVDLPVTGATSANPIVITASAPHNLVNGSIATISGVLGNTLANGTFAVTVLSPTSFSIPVNGIAGGAYVSGTGLIEGGDLGEIDAFLQQSCVPETVTEQTVAATSVNGTIFATVYVQAAYAPQVQSAVRTALVNYAASLPIGGVILPGGGGTNIVPYSEVLGAMTGALPQILSVNPMLFNGAVSDLSIGPYGILQFPIGSIILNIVPVA
jgi:hypothetical protein